jgi:hypothetical protein
MNMLVSEVLRWFSMASRSSWTVKINTPKFHQWHKGVSHAASEEVYEPNTYELSSFQRGAHEPDICGPQINDGQADVMQIIMYARSFEF